MNIPLGWETCLLLAFIQTCRFDQRRFLYVENQCNSTRVFLHCPKAVIISEGLYIHPICLLHTYVLHHMCISTGVL